MVDGRNEERWDADGRRVWSRVDEDVDTGDDDGRRMMGTCELRDSMSVLSTRDSAKTRISLVLKLRGVDDGELTCWCEQDESSV